MYALMLKLMKNNESWHLSNFYLNIQNKINICVCVCINTSKYTIYYVGNMAHPSRCSNNLCIHGNLCEELGLLKVLSLCSIADVDIAVLCD